MNDLQHLDTVHDLLTNTNGEVEDGYLISGAIVIGLYVSPDGEAVATWYRNLGAMNAFTQEGVLRERLRELIEHMTESREDDA